MNNLDKIDVVTKLETTRMMFLRSIMKLADNVSSNRFRMTLNTPKILYELFLRLKKVVDKYKMHFGEEPSLYKSTLENYHNELSEYLGKRSEGLSEKELNVAAKRWSVVKLGREENIVVGDNFFKGTMRSLYQNIDGRDRCMIM